MNHNDDETTTSCESVFGAVGIRAELVLGLHRRSPCTFKEAWERYILVCTAKNKPRTVRDYERLCARHFRFGTAKLTDISRADIQRRLDALKDTPSEQHHAFVALRIFFGWAVREELLDVNPMATFRRVGKTTARDRLLADEELAAIWQRAGAYPAPYGAIMQLLILTGQRRGEIAALQWDWIDAKERTITLPPTLTKNKRLHVFPYGEQTAAVLASLPHTGEHLFPARTKTGTIFNGWGKCKERFDASLTDVAPYTLHDLRRTYSSTMARLGTPIHVTEKLLNHISGTVSGVAAVYNRYSYQSEMREAVERFDRFLLVLAQDEI